MAYMFVMGPCYSCGVPFTYNAERVPSIPVLPDGTIGAGGRREPICEHCMTVVNERRKAMGMPPHPIREGAYDAQEVD